MKLQAEKKWRYNIAQWTRESFATTQALAYDRQRWRQMVLRWQCSAPTISKRVKGFVIVIQWQGPSCISTLSMHRELALNPWSGAVAALMLHCVGDLSTPPPLPPAPSPPAPSPENIPRLCGLWLSGTICLHYTPPVPWIWCCSVYWLLWSLCSTTLVSICALRRVQAHRTTDTRACNDSTCKKHATPIWCGSFSGQIRCWSRTSRLGNTISNTDSVS